MPGGGGRLGIDGAINEPIPPVPWHFVQSSFHENNRHSNMAFKQVEYLPPVNIFRVADSCYGDAGLN